MSETNPDKNNSGILTKFLSVIALISAALYFTGWVYRWAYFSFFQISILSLNFGIQSFYLAAFQALFGSYLTILRTAIAIILTILAISLTLLFIPQLIKKFFNKTLFRFISLQSRAINFLLSLGDEIIIVLWVLFILFHLAQWQGDRDARIDATNETSTLPVITLINPSESSPLGKTLDDPFSSPDPNKFRIIGDVQRYANLTTQDDTNVQESRVWRLLLEANGTAYLFPALPQGSAPNLRPPMLMVKTNSNQMIIISPEVYKK